MKLRQKLRSPAAPKTLPEHVYRMQIALVRQVNDTHTFVQQALPLLQQAKQRHEASKDPDDRHYTVPARGKQGIAKRNDAFLVEPFIGRMGMLTTGTHGDMTRLIPVERMKDYCMPAPLLTRSPGHMRDFIRACKGGDPACSNFHVSAPFVEWMLLGVIALRHEGKLEYDPDKMRITNNSDANKLLKPTFRKGWELRALKA